jgi:Uma2 family endonuclease
MTTTRLMTADEFFEMETEDCYRYDLIDGEVIRMAAAGFEHGMLAAEVGRLLGNWVKPRGLGIVVGAETGFILARNPDVVLGPDAAFVRAGRLPPRGTWERFLPVAPDLAVEVISPSERRGQLEREVRRYLHGGVPLLWLLRPRRRTVQVYRADGTSTILNDADMLDGEDVLPSFRLAVTELFA